VAVDAGPIPTENHFPCRTLVACLGAALWWAVIDLTGDTAGIAQAFVQSSERILLCLQGPFIDAKRTHKLRKWQTSLRCFWAYFRGTYDSVCGAGDPANPVDLLTSIAASFPSARCLLHSGNPRSPTARASRTVPCTHTVLQFWPDASRSLFKPPSPCTSRMCITR